MKQIIFTLSALSAFCFGQIQYGGEPLYYSDRDVEIDFFSILSETTKIDRDFHPMVFQYGDEYLVDECAGKSINSECDYKSSWNNADQGRCIQTNDEWNKLGVVTKDNIIKNNLLFKAKINGKNLNTIIMMKMIFFIENISLFITF